MRVAEVICSGMLVVGMATSFSARAQGSDRPSAFGPGEQSSYRVSYLGVTAGTAQVTVGSEMSYGGRPVWPIVALAQSASLGAVYPVKDKFVTYWDHSVQRTLGSDLFADENRKKRRQRIQLNGTQAVVTKQNQGEREVVRTFDVHPETTDMAAVAFALRNVEFKSGSEHQVPVFTGVKSFMLKASVEGTEQIETQLGEREVFRVRVSTDFSGKLAAKRDIVVYFTTDEARVPVKIEADLILGSVVAEITDYKPGRRLAMVGQPAQGGS